MTDSLQGKSVFITGGGSGIGEALVRGFAKAGAYTAFIDIDQTAGEALQQSLSKETKTNGSSKKPRSAATSSVSSLFFHGDVCDEASLENAITQAAQKHNGIDILVNNAANDMRHDFASVSVEMWDSLIKLNLSAYFFTIQKCAPYMQRQKQGSIINLSSGSVLLGIAEYPAYITAKAGIIGLTRGLARELGPDRIRVNTVLPGWVMTEKQRKEHITPEDLKKCLEEQAIHEEIFPEDITPTVLFLAGDGSRMITGQSLVVDGGRAFH